MQAKASYWDLKKRGSSTGINVALLLYYHGFYDTNAMKKYS
jgi:hypothetical protein